MSRDLISSTDKQKDIQKALGNLFEAIIIARRETRRPKVLVQTHQQFILTAIELCGDEDMADCVRVCPPQLSLSHFTQIYPLSFCIKINRNIHLELAIRGGSKLLDEFIVPETVQGTDAGWVRIDLLPAVKLLKERSPSMQPVLDNLMTAYLNLLEKEKKLGAINDEAHSQVVSRVDALFEFEQMICETDDQAVISMEVCSQQQHAKPAKPKQVAVTQPILPVQDRSQQPAESTAEKVEKTRVHKERSESKKIAVDRSRQRTRRESLRRRQPSRSRQRRRQQARQHEARRDERRTVRRRDHRSRHQRHQPHRDRYYADRHRDHRDRAITPGHQRYANRQARVGNWDRRSYSTSGQSGFFAPRPLPPHPQPQYRQQQVRTEVPQVNTAMGGAFNTEVISLVNEFLRNVLNAQYQRDADERQQGTGQVTRQGYR